jgi:transposase
MGRRVLSEYIRVRIIVLIRTLLSLSQAWRALLAEGIKVDRKTVGNTWKRWLQRGTTSYATSTGRQPRYFRAISKYIDQQMIEQNDLTAGELSAFVYRDLNLLVPARSIQRIRNQLGWKCHNVKYAQFVRECNRQPRVDYCKEIVSGIRVFDNVVFTDETTVQLEWNRKKCYVKNNESLMRIRSKVKHPIKVHVWAGISANGQTKLAFFDGKHRMNSSFFCKILRTCFLPFAQQWNTSTGTTCYLQQDNDPKHKSKFTAKWMSDNGVKAIWWPSESPDLNPIECLWHQLKDYLRSQVKPVTKAELIGGIEAFWKNKVTVELCRRYCAHIYKVAPMVIESNGGPTTK